MKFLLIIPIFALVLGYGLIRIFDIQKPPGSDVTQWHAYLTAEEVQHPLAKYWYAQADVNPKVMAAIQSGPMDEAEILSWDDRSTILEPDYHSVENGWVKLSDGGAYVAVKTFFPGATAQMLDWWFEWAQKEEQIRYKIWYPGSHVGMSEIDTPGSPDYPDTKASWGKTRFPVEDVGMGVAQIRLDFVPPSEFGFDELPVDSTMIAVRVGMPNALFKHTDMIHYIRPVEGGVEMRSRFWMAREIEAMSGSVGIAAFFMNNSIVKKAAIQERMAKELALHCATEFSQLASFLPELYELYGPK